ncbi:hypothetical protein HYQ00_gp52 [Arthrobacter phage TripleJ]|uniref:Uncharacterized protein n=1 Tax=Arthrobacter phage TripleJ TaxID=2599838 RepID=A0A5J6TFX7_9CAUD|nr:hypothetical protein HYQ00_gp52 [Arthrobacter phage TripleJ]QFG09596.1 hypothetical protein PBI_TRIPLEJ_52 [Arthrobacter phage TripleJ]
MTQCYCGGNYRCQDCRRDVCYCNCEHDGTPDTQAEVTAGHVNPSTARLEAWAQKQELTRA